MKNKKMKIVWLIKIVVAILLMTIIYKHINRKDEIFTAFAEANWVNIFLCVLLLIPNFFIQYYKWRYILKVRYPEMDKLIPFQSLLFGSTLGFITPGSLGELARGLFFKKYNRMVITGLNFIDKFSGTIVFTTIGFVSFNLIVLKYFNWERYITIPMMILSLFFLLIVWVISLNPQWIRSFLYGVNTMLPARDKIKSFISCLDVVQRKHILAMFGFGVLWFSIIFMQYHMLILAFTNVPLAESFLAVGATLFTKIALPISFADLGIREGAAVFYYNLFNINSAASFNAAVLIFVINFLIPATSGAYFVFRLRWESDKNDMKVPADDHR